MKKEDIQLGDRVMSASRTGTVVALDMSLVTHKPQWTDPNCVSVIWDDQPDKTVAVHTTNFVLVHHAAKPFSQQDLANIALACCEMSNFGDIAHALNSAIVKSNACGDPKIGDNFAIRLMLLKLVYHSTLAPSFIDVMTLEDLTKSAIDDCNAMAVVTDEVRETYKLLKDLEGQIPAIKAFRAATNCSLKFAKDFIDSLG